MDLRLFCAVLVGKIIFAALKLKGSGGTAAPGLYALYIDPNLVKKLAKKNGLNSIVISGTNGKTTTARLVSDILGTKYKIIHNRAGSNLLRGVASTLITNSSLFGALSCQLALWEVDEAALLPISKQLKINTLVLLNLFRDQLDRYGEIDTTRKKWIEVVKSLEPTTNLILNADDPSTNYLAKFTKAKKLFFGVDVDRINLPTVENVSDVKYCINCGQKLTYQKTYSAHLGVYFCSNCSFKRNNPNIRATNIRFNPNFTTSLKLSIHHSPLTVNYPLPGLYNVYNILAAYSVTSRYKIPATLIKNKIENFAAVFGRFQLTQVGDKYVSIFLIKNPAGANEVIRILKTQKTINTLIILNDNIADGRDVSWIWDTNWESLKGCVQSVSISGTRAWDMTLRLKYARFKLNNNSVYKDISYSIEATLANLDKNNTLVILPTYTALLEVQKSLLKLGGKKWHKQ